MNRETEVHNELGEENVKRFVRNVRNGSINKAKLEQISWKMGGNVHGTITQNEARVDPDHLALLLLDTWYNEELYKPDIDSKRRFFDILKDENVRLGALASKMINDQYHDGNSSNAEESEETTEENNNNYLQSNTEDANVDSAHTEIEESIESSALFLSTHDQEENRVQIEDDENQRDSNNYECIKILLPMLMFSKKR